MAKTAILPASVMLSAATRNAKTDIQGLNYSQIPGAASYAAAAPDGTLWVLSNQPAGPDKYIWHYVNGTWSNISGLAARLSVAPNGTLYAINSGGGTYAYSAGAWTALGGGASDITVAADGSIDVLSNGNSAGSDQAIWHYSSGWSQLPGSGVKIAASWDSKSYTLPSGTVSGAGLYILNSLGNIYYENPNNSFVQLPGNASAIAPTTIGGLFVLGYPPNANGSSVYYYDLNAAGWKGQNGAGLSISSDSARLYVVAASGAMYSSIFSAPPITIDANAPTLATINKNVFGTNLTNSMGLSSANSRYGSMMASFQSARFGMFRWPGGVLADYYHWQTNSFSACAVSAYGFTSRTTFDEFVQQVVQPLGADANITVNYGSNSACSGGGDPNEAAGWVDYANNQKHYAIKFWTIGNEMYFGGPTLGPTPTTPDFNVPAGSPGATASTTYANLVATQFYPLMKAKDPTIQVGVDLVVPDNNVSSRASPWDSTVLSNAKYDFVEVHWYGNSPGNVEIGDTALLTTGISYFASALAQLRAELGAVGKASTPIYVGEWGIPGPNSGSAQDNSIVGALYTAMVWGELIKGGIGTAGSWQGYISDCFPSSSNDYAWLNWFSSSFFEATPTGGTNPQCPSSTLPPLGTPFPRARALQVVEQAFNPGDTAFAPTVSSSLASVKAYGAKRGSGYGIMLVNTDQNNAATTTLTFANDLRSFNATSLTYGKSQYDDARNNVWTAPLSQSLGTVSGSFPVNLPPWSITAITLAS